MRQTAVAHTEVDQLREKVMLLVPGFRGYRDSGADSDDDGRLRVEICERLDWTTAHLEDVLFEISENGWNPGVEAIDLALRRLESVRERATTREESPGQGAPPSPGNDGVQVASLLEADLALLVELDALGGLVDNLGFSHFAGRRLRDTLAALDRRVSAVESSLQRRFPFLATDPDVNRPAA